MKYKVIVSCAFVAAAASLQAHVASVDFTRVKGDVRPELHSSGWTPRMTAMSQGVNPDVEIVKSMGFKSARTHDWALVNTGQRVVDTHFIFPLMHLDANDPKNYVFAPTDHLLGLTRETGLDIFYRLGTSIEHTGPKVHFNAAVPEDFNKVADVFAGIVRHYNRGWGKDGKKWGIKYWEIWNEPDGWNNMWVMPGGDTEENDKIRRAKFCEFYALCIKRLKGEFGDEIKVGGPALCSMNEPYFKELFAACKKLGVAPDFISWHYYGDNPSEVVYAADKARKICDDAGFPKCELIINEWHYMGCRWQDLRSANPAVSALCQKGPTGHNNIDSAAFTLATLSLFQTSKYDQAFYYGCSHVGHWGYMNSTRQFNKNYYACRLFGEIVNNYSKICGSEVFKRNYYALAVKAADESKALLLVDFRNTDQIVKIKVSGVKKGAKVRAIALDHTRDNFPCEATFEDGELTLTKPDKYSAAFYVTFR